MPRTPIALLALAALLLSSPARAQHVAIVNATVEGHEGPVTIVIRKGKVRSVGPLRRPPRDLLVVDAKGGKVLPGRIDAWAAIDGDSPLGDARDGFDPFAPQVQEALAQGVTTVCLVPRAGRSGSNGAAALIKLRPGKPVEAATVTTQVAVCAGLGGADEGPLEHATRLGALEDALEEAGRYRDEWAAYEEALAEWLRTHGVAPGGGTTAAVDTRGGAAAVDTRGGTAPVTSPAPPDGPRRGRGGGRRPPRTPPQPGPGGASGDEAGADGEGEEADPLAFHVPDEDGEPDPPRPRRGRRGPPGPAPDGPPAEGGEAPQAPQKPGDPPRRPRVDRGKALLARVVGRELPLLIQADRAEDILGALELQDRFHLRLILVGLAEGHRVLDALRGREELALVLGPQAPAGAPGGATPDYPPGEGAPPVTPPWSARRPLRADPATAGQLAGLSLPLAIGSGDLSASRFVELNAALAGGGGLAAAGVEAAITRGPAAVLGLSGRLGVIAPDADADLVIYPPPGDGPTLGAGASPVLVLIDGQVAWRAP